MASGQTTEIEERHITRGREHTVQVVKTPVKDDDGRTVGIFGIFWDITARKEAEAGVVEWKNRYEAAVQASGNILYDWNADTGEVIYGGSVEKILGYAVEDMQGGLDQWMGLIHPDDRQGFRDLIDRLMKTRQSVHAHEYRIRSKDGRYIPAEDSGQFFLDGRGNPVRMVGFVKDISSRKRAEEQRRSLEAQIQHAQKLESLGVLAGGIAHDFNNLLLAILGNADLALMDMAPEAPARENVDEIRKASQRAAELARQMLAYSGKGRFIVEALDLSKVVEEMAHMLEVSVSKKAVLKYNFGANLPAIEADATQVRQVIMNLITNASEAIGDRSGVISISTGALNADRDYLRETYFDENLPEGLYVTLEVADTGCGMDAETQAKLFDPFFTTKFTGRGLGMAAVLGIVRGHRGAIHIQSEPGKGTTMKLLFPGIEGRAVTQGGGAESVDSWRGSGTVLLVDDEETVRAVGRTMLQRLGMTVVTARDGREAVEIFAKRSDEIDCIILDLTMPHMDGEQAYRELRRIRDDVRVIMSSGYNEQEVTQRFVGKGLAGFIQKPYELARLRNILRSVVG